MEIGPIGGPHRGLYRLLCPPEPALAPCCARNRRCAASREAGVDSARPGPTQSLSLRLSLSLSWIFYIGYVRTGWKSRSHSKLLLVDNNVGEAVYKNISKVQSPSSSRYLVIYGGNLS